MKVVWVGTPAFQHHMKKQGLPCVHIPLKEFRLIGWDDIVREAGMEPDVLVYSDRSFPPPILGLERFPCRTCLYVVDSHIHSWMPNYARSFDCRAVSLRDHLPRFEAGTLPGTTRWLPPYPRDMDQPVKDAEKRWDVLFVGNVNPETTPLRQKFLSELESLLPPGTLHVTTGTYRELFPHARIVLNIAERGDLNFRVFEALGCGACLLTPEVGHGQSELFTPGVHFETYAGLDAANAATKINTLLNDADKRAALARDGHRIVEANHRMTNRGVDLIELFSSNATTQAQQQRLAHPGANAKDLRLLYLHWAEAIDNPAIRSGYMAAAGALAKA